MFITWSVVLWFWEYVDNSTSKRWHLKTQLMFQWWRLWWFFVLGWILGLIWSVFQFSIVFKAVFLVIISFFVIFMWLHMVGVVPSLTKFWFHLPRSWTDRILTIKNPFFAPLVWILTFFLPCWFTQSMQVVAMSTWSFWLWGMVMLMFALGTFPVLLLVGLWGSAIKHKKFDFVRKIIWILVLLFGLYSLSNWWSLFPKKDILDVSQSSWNEFISYQKIQLFHNWWWLEDNDIVLKSGNNYEIEIIPKTNGKWCMTSLIIPKISSQVYPVLSWQIIRYQVRNIKPWTYDVVCGTMGMPQWRILVK